MLVFAIPYIYIAKLCLQLNPHSFNDFFFAMSPAFLFLFAKFRMYV